MDWCVPFIGDISDSETIELEFREGTDMEAVPALNGRHLGLQFRQQICLQNADGREARLLAGVTIRPGRGLVS